eukprot:1194978-Prorocentrum_minimum.AAC.8
MVGSGGRETFCIRSDTLACAIFYDPSFDRQSSGLGQWTTWSALALAAALLGWVGYSGYSKTKASALKRAYASDANLAAMAASPRKEPKKAKLAWECHNGGTIQRTRALSIVGGDNAMHPPLCHPHHGMASECIVIINYNTNVHIWESCRRTIDASGRGGGGDRTRAASQSGKP